MQKINLAITQPHINSSKSITMSYSNSELRAATEFIFPGSGGMAAQSVSTTASTDLLIKGQGVFIFRRVAGTNKHKDTFVRFSNDNYMGIELTLSLDELSVVYIDQGSRTVLKKEPIGLIENDNAFYWVCLDSNNLRLSFGIGEARPETLKYSYKFDGIHRDKLRTAASVQYSKVLTIPLRLLRDPIFVNDPSDTEKPTFTVPMYVKNTDELTMDDIAANKAMPRANLSPIGQKLYDNIAGKKFTLNDDNFPDFVEAIEHSIRTKGLCCYNLLEKKRAKQPADHQNRVYLRITLGHNGGESPGIPYVMEIWPPGCYSSIHNHAGANAIIRVLHGEIFVALFPFLGTDASFGSATFKKDQVTWISPTLNQFHYLKNTHIDEPKKQAETCITIQCYMYDETDTGHYSYFDYIADDDTIHKFDPNSDMDFIAFKKAIKEEWEKRK